MINTDVKMLAMYEDLLEKIQVAMEAAQKIGKDGQDGKDGRDAPDYSKQMFAIMATLHSDLMKQLISLERDVKVEPQIQVNAPQASGYTFEVERNNKGLIERVQAKPTTNSI